MSIARTEIRAAVITEVKTRYSGDVFGTEISNISDIDECLTVRIIQGDYDNTGVSPMVAAMLMVGIHKKLGTDDELDDISLAFLGIENRELYPSLVAGIYPDSFSYEQDESGSLNSLFLKYTIIYKESN